MMLNGKMLLKSNILAKRKKSINSEHMKPARTKKAIGLYGCIPVLRARKIKKEGLKKIDRAQKALEELIPKLNAYHLKTQKDITKAVNKICKDVQGLIDVKITKGRKQILKRIPSTRRRAGDPIYENKWVI